MGDFFSNFNNYNNFLIIKVIILNICCTFALFNNDMGEIPFI